MRPVGGPSIAVQPASITSVLPLKELTASDARKAMALATSAASSRRWRPPQPSRQPPPGQIEGFFFGLILKWIDGTDELF